MKKFLTAVLVSLGFVAFADTDLQVEKIQKIPFNTLMYTKYGTDVATSNGIVEFFSKPIIGLGLNVDPATTNTVYHGFVAGTDASNGQDFGMVIGHGSTAEARVQIEPVFKRDKNGKIITVHETRVIDGLPIERDWPVIDHFNTNHTASAKIIGDGSTAKFGGGVILGDSSVSEAPGIVSVGRGNRGDSPWTTSIGLWNIFHEGWMNAIVGHNNFISNACDSVVIGHGRIVGRNGLIGGSVVIGYGECTTSDTVIINGRVIMQGGVVPANRVGNNLANRVDNLERQVQALQERLQNQQQGILGLAQKLNAREPGTVTMDDLLEVLSK